MTELSKTGATVGGLLSTILTVFNTHYTEQGRARITTMTITPEDIRDYSNGTSRATVVLSKNPSQVDVRGARVIQLTVSQDAMKAS